MTYATSASEAMIQRAIVQHLALRAAPGVAWFAIPNGGSRSKAEAAIMAGTGTRPGVPDLAVIRAGHFHGLELKSARGNLSPAQRVMHDVLRAAGATITVARGVDEALAVLASWQCLRSGGR